MYLFAAVYRKWNAMYERLFCIAEVARYMYTATVLLKLLNRLTSNLRPRLFCHGKMPVTLGCASATVPLTQILGAGGGSIRRDILGRSARFTNDLDPRC